MLAIENTAGKRKGEGVGVKHQGDHNLSGCGYYLSLVLGMCFSTEGKRKKRDNQAGNKHQDIQGS